MVLCGTINKEIVGLISSQSGVRGAIGLSGLDAGLIKASLMRKVAVDESGVEKVINLGRVGDPTDINTSLIRDLLALKLVPVIAPIAAGPDGNSLNINADTAAGAVAEALNV